MNRKGVQIIIITMATEYRKIYTDKLIFERRSSMKISALLQVTPND